VLVAVCTQGSVAERMPVWAAVVIVVLVAECTPASAAGYTKGSAAVCIRGSAAASIAGLVAV
jgi:hypothetical protein